jgi:hypothetical protein
MNPGPRPGLRNGAPLAQKTITMRKFKNEPRKRDHQGTKVIGEFVKMNRRNGITKRRKELENLLK